jgi:hypothetical protein
MFTWYSRTQVCYVYLSDVPALEDYHELESAFRGSKWFTRGWTLQELIAPQVVEFFNESWIEIGTRLSLQQLIVSITGITHLFNFKEASVAQKMSWASKRETSRLEDRAYCLMGLFDVNMPPLYGEGVNAFIRLQLEILSKHDDETIFAWNTPERLLPLIGEGLLAYSPAYFESSGSYTRGNFDLDRSPPTMTSKGLRMELKLFPSDRSQHWIDRYPTTCRAPLNCATNISGGVPKFLCLELVKTVRGWARNEDLVSMRSWIGDRVEDSRSEVVFFKQTQRNLVFLSEISKKPDKVLFRLQSPIQSGYSVTQRYFLGSYEHPSWIEDGPFDLVIKASWFPNQPAALLFVNNNYQCIVVVVGRSSSNTLWVDLEILSLRNANPDSLQVIAKAISQQWKDRPGPDRACRVLPDGLSVSLSLKQEIISNTSFYVVVMTIHLLGELRRLDVQIF